MPGEATGAIEVRVRYALSAGLGLLALALAAGALGQLSPALNGILAVGALMATALVTVRRPVGAPGRRLVAAGVLAIAALPLVARGGPLAPTGAALFFLGLSLVAPAGDGVPSALVATALFFGAWQALVAHVPLLWHARQWGSIAFSWFAGVGLRLGPTALGLPIFLLFLLFALTTAALPGGPSRWRCVARALLWVALLVGALVAYLWLQPPLASWLQQHWPASPYGGQETLPPRPTYLESLPLLFVLLWLATAIAGWRPGPLAAGWPLRRRALGWGLAGLVLLCAAVLVLGLDPGYTPRRGVVLFYDAGQLDWGRPEYGRYGARSGGTYGLWPDYLSLYGYEFRVAN